MTITDGYVRGVAADLFRDMFAKMTGKDRHVTIVVRTNGEKITASIDRQTGVVSPINRRERGAARKRPR